MKLNKQTGQSLLEFALVLPVLLLLLVGIIEFSLVLYDQAVITNAAREGARAGIVYNNRALSDNVLQNTIVIPAVNNYCQNYLIGFSANTVTTKAQKVIGPIDLWVQVTVTYNYSWLAFPNFVTIANPFPLTSKALMRFE